MSNLYEGMRFWIKKTTNVTEEEIQAKSYIKHNILYEVNQGISAILTEYIDDLNEGRRSQQDIKDFLPSEDFVNLILSSDKKAVEKEWISRVEPIETILQREWKNRKRFVRKFQDLFTLCTGYDSIGQALIDTTLEISEYQVTRIEGAVGQLENFSKKLPSIQEIIERTRINSLLLELSDNGILDFDDLMNTIIRDKKMDSVSFYQLASLTSQEVSVPRKKIIIVLCLWILNSRFDKKVYTILKNQLGVSLDIELLQMMILSLSNLILVHKENFGIYELLKCDLDSINARLSLHNEGKSVNKEELNVIKINYTHLEQPDLLFEIIGNESSILFLQDIIQKSNSQNSVIPYIKKLHGEMNEIIEGHQKYFDRYPRFKAIVALRRLVTFGKNDLMIRSRRSSEGSIVSHYSGTAYEIIKQNENEDNVLGIPLLIGEKVKNELDSLFGLK